MNPLSGLVVSLNLRPIARSYKDLILIFIRSLVCMTVGHTLNSDKIRHGSK